MKIEQDQEIIHKLTVKETELREALEEKAKFEEKMNSLLDILYGCPECGLNSCECINTDESITEPTPDSDSSTPAPAETPSATLPSSPCGGRP